MAVVLRANYREFCHDDVRLSTNRRTTMFRGISRLKICGPDRRAAARKPRRPAVYRPAISSRRRRRRHRAPTTISPVCCSYFEQSALSGSEIQIKRAPPVICARTNTRSAKRVPHYSPTYHVILHAFTYG